MNSATSVPSTGAQRSARFSSWAPLCCLQFHVLSFAINDYPSEVSVQIKLNGVTFDLKAAHDFGWLNEIGNPFLVFSEQDSGNLCFGVLSESTLSFVKYAGARTINYMGDTAGAVHRLKEAARVHQDLRHPVLPNLIRSIDTTSGFALVLEWINGEGLHPRHTFPPPLKYEHPDSPFRRFRQLPLPDRLRAFDRILDFHVSVEERGYVAVDLYDGSLLYDFNSRQMYVCDVDFYHPSPFENRMGRLWGSSRFMAPEEFELGAWIDNRTNVFTLGAVAFCCFGSDRDRSKEYWDAGDETYAIAHKAISSSRSDRYSSIAKFRDAWSAAVAATQHRHRADGRGNGREIPC